MKSENVVQCTECRQVIDSSEDVSFVCFRVPGTADYHYFHWHPRGNDCWQAYLKAHRLQVSSRKA